MLGACIAAGRPYIKMVLAVVTAPALALLRGLLGGSLRVGAHILRKIIQQPSLLWPPHETLPVAGLDAITVQELAFALQHAVQQPEVGAWC